MIKAGAGTGQIEILSRYLEKDYFLNRYVRKDGSEEDCRLCPYYGKRWSCPPGLPHAYSYLEKYQNLCLVALKVSYSQETRRKAKEDTEYADQVREELYESAKRELLKKLLKLSSGWIQEGTENIDRTLAVQSENSHQFIADFYFDQTWTRPMPIYGVPGLSSI